MRYNRDKKGWRGEKMTLTADRIRQSRKDKDFTLQELANLMQVNKSTIVKWENGTNAPRLATLEKLSGFLEVDKGYLVGTQNERRTQSLTEFVESTDENQLIYHYRHLSRENKDILKTLAGLMFEKQK
ncbi:helix-turn-helix transcriptional regulator [Lactococcus sp. dk322]|nr:helix-turn-helix domain-containing protein [Lactococcus sp. dk101]TXK44691.1 helix-turn-helix transcriptional regulator [Lactococcus sp. dk310]TXK50585.1 helix-turn-helix transcriptional regulator [Lactococcus sp. dk322]